MSDPENQIWGHTIFNTPSDDTKKHHQNKGEAMRPYSMPTATSYRLATAKRRQTLNLFLTLPPPDRSPGVPPPPPPSPEQQTEGEGALGLAGE